MTKLQELHNEELNKAFLRGYLTKEKEILSLILPAIQGKTKHTKAKRILHYNNGILQNIFTTQKEAARQTGYSQPHIANILSNNLARTTESKRGDSFEYLK